MSTIVRGTGIEKVEFTTDDIGGSPSWTQITGEIDGDPTYPEMTANTRQNSAMEDLQADVEMRSSFSVINLGAAEITTLKGYMKNHTRVWFRFTGAPGVTQIVGGRKGCTVQVTDRVIAAPGQFGVTTITIHVRDANDEDVQSFAVAT